MPIHRRSFSALSAPIRSQLKTEILSLPPGYGPDNALVSQEENLPADGPISGLVPSIPYLRVNCIDVEGSLLSE